jgi:hypothetical protein
VCGQSKIIVFFTFYGRRPIMQKILIYLISFVFVLVLTLTSTASAELTAWWRFDDGSGTIAVDTSGNGYDGTLEGDPQWVAGQLGDALEFDGSGDRVVAANIPFDNRSFTIAMWVNPVLYTGEQVVFSTGLTGANDTDMHLRIGGEGSGNVPPGGIRMGFYNNDLDTPGGLIEENTWYHITFWYDYENRNRRIYINGVLEAEAAAAPYLGTTGNTVIGAWGTGQWFQGIIDDVQVYNHPLTENEIQAVMLGLEGYPYASSPVPKDGVLHPDTWVSLSWRAGDFAVSHNVYLGENFDDVNAGSEGTFQGNQPTTFFVIGFPGFPYSDGLVPGTTYYWRIDEVNDTEPNSPWKGAIWSFGIPPKTAYYPDPADGAESIDVGVRLSWTAGFGAKLHTVYFGDNFDEVNNATGGLPQGTTSYTPGPLELAKTYYWRVDEFDITETYKGEVWSFTTEGAVGSPNPANGAVDIKQTPILSWTPGVFAASHQVYFGADKETVRNATTASPEYKGIKTLGSETFDPGILDSDSTYYWRIDEVNDANPDSPWTGNVWSFTTANFLIVDDFEDYDAGDNQIWYAWKDGLGYGAPGTDPYYPGNGSGSAVGDENTPSYTEETIVHGGSQAMPLFYDNNKQGFFKYSEAELTLTYPRDWTEKGVNTLTIWFRGDSANAAEILYVALNGSAVISNDNPDAALITDWTDWNIDLQAFADQGVNLANVNTIALGLGNKNNPIAGGSGTMYFDDIRLYPPLSP